MGSWEKKTSSDQPLWCLALDTNFARREGAELILPPRAPQAGNSRWKLPGLNGV